MLWKVNDLLQGIKVKNLQENHLIETSRPFPCGWFGKLEFSSDRLGPHKAFGTQDPTSSPAEQRQWLKDHGPFAPGPSGKSQIEHSNALKVYSESGHPSSWTLPNS